ncbi:MAG: DUF1987 domain-containing protein [Cytophagales bacterium]|nr:DUF1987 domain-containing protein [Cytophagales bacterium]
MDNITMTIESTQITPFVQLDAKAGILEFKGRSSSSASLEFYYPILSNIDKTFVTGTKTFTANFAFEYFNTSSSKCLFDILKRLAQFKSQGMDVRVNWYYEECDDNMKETGEDYEDVLGMSFNYIAIKEF